MISGLIAPQIQAGLWDDIKKKATDVTKKVVDKETDKTKKAPQSPEYNQKLVADTQQQLNRIGYNVGVVDGLYGSGTKRAIEHFQQNQNIAVNGKPSEVLLSRMETTKAPENTVSQKTQSTQNTVSKTPSKTVAPKSDTASSKTQQNNIQSNKHSLPLKPEGAEETLTDLYLTIVRLRPDLLEKKPNQQNAKSLLEVMLRKDPERYGLDFKSVMEFINDEFTHNKRFKEYKDLVLNAAADAPLVYRHKVTSLLTKYNFDSKEYGIRKLNMATFYTLPFFRLFEGGKTITAFKMSPEAAEALIEWHGNKTRENIIGFWSYKVKSMMHANELKENSALTNGYIAEVEPLEFVIYVRRDVVDRSKKHVGRTAWDRPPTKTEYQKITRISLENLSKNSSLGINPLSKFDIVGVKLGATPEKVTAAIKSHNAALVLKKEMKRLDIPESPPYVNKMVKGQSNLANALDNFTISFAAPPFKNTVIGINRELNLKSKPSSFKAVVSSLEKKYGQPDKSIRQNSSNDSYYNHEYTWLDADSTVKLTVIVGVLNNKIVERMTFRVTDSVNRNDATRRYQRNQQLWKSYHKGKPKPNTAQPAQTEDVPDF